MPEAGYGRFWNFMRTMPGAEFTPLLDAKGPAVEGATPKRTHGKVKDGSTAKCIVLATLQKQVDDGEGPLTTGQLTDAIVMAGKAPKSVGNVLHELVKAKRIKRGDEGYTITAAGSKWYETSCPVAE